MCCKPVISRLIHLLAVLTLPACDASEEQDPLDPLAGANGSAVVFLALRELPNAHMEALFQGRVILDEAGCLRLDSDRGSTVVWPFGATLERIGTELRVRSIEGRVIGSIGAGFRFGGGHVPSLHEGIQLTPADRDRARNCLGEFWIVGEVP